MAEKMPLEIDVTAKAAGGTYDYVKSEAVPQGEIWCLQNVAYENETGARGTFRRGVERAGFYKWYWEYESPAADELVFSEAVSFLYPGESLAVRQASATANDILHLYARGYRVKSKFIPD